MAEFPMGDDRQTEILGARQSPGPEPLPGGRLTPNNETMVRRVGTKATMAWLIPTTGIGAGRMFRVDPGGTVIGRDPATSQMVLNDERVSGMHAKVRGELIDGRMRYHILDMGSANGTYVDDVKVDRQRLDDGARIRVGATELQFKQSVR